MVKNILVALWADEDSKWLKGHEVLDRMKGKLS